MGYIICVFLEEYINIIKIIVIYIADLILEYIIKYII